MAWWAMAGDWSAKAVDQYLGQDQAHKANRTNIMLNRENRDWMTGERIAAQSYNTEMSNTAIQRRVSDLKGAGLNPMLAYSDSASSPQSSGMSSQPARVESTYTSGKEAANPRLQESMLLKAQTDKLKAEARSANADAIQKEAAIPYSAKTADLNYGELFKRVDILSKQAAALQLSNVGSDISNKQAEALKPMMVEYQELVNQASKLGLSEAKALSDFYESAGGAGKWMELLKNMSILLKR